ncbi:hypothetical protein [Haloparvum sedimenti]|uniref:hypothetical protein n=1 Tax=Haloparvum sedimenti TaxID=1678448 RepID=UPI00071E81F4|nr:hypothetical protein [Haloparvum sedimenti]
MVTVQSHVRPGGAVNEDLVRTHGNAVVVLDGATGLSDRSVTDAASDGRWYVEALAEELGDRIDEGGGRGLRDLASEAVAAVADRYGDHPGAAEQDSHEVPSAAGAVLRWDDDLEYLVLGDCGVVVDAGPESRAVLGEGPRELDRRVVEEMVAIREAADGAVSYESLRERVHPMLVDHRKRKNREGGYWTFGLDPSAVDHAATGSLDRRDAEFAVAFTDGFEPVCTTYDAFADWSTLVPYLRTDGIERAVRILRAFEESDPECREYPRLKPSDDVAVATVDLSE